ncbi:MAG TPA: ThiF family adenylyltransferase [Acidobacteriota bacterium]|nr:ThiF family adenylyltransferase [Acidobacteriota bacterium]
MTYLDANIAAIGKSAVQNLQSMRPLVIGKDLATDYAMFCLAGLGCRQMMQFEYGGATAFDACGHDYKYASKNEALWKTLTPYCDVTSFQGIALQDAIEQYKPTCIINATQSTTKCSIPQINIATNQYQTTISRDTIDISRRQNRRSNLMQALSGILAADEIRKMYFLHASNEQSIKHNLKIDLQNLRTPATMYETEIAHATIIGCGGIGTYCAAALALNNTKNIHLIDADTVEQTNLNRQIFYANHIGKSKAQALSQTLRKAFPNTQWSSTQDFIRRDTVDALLQKHTRVFCCTDNYASRLLVSRYCQTHAIPLVEAGCDTQMAGLFAYIPNQTHTVHCARNLVEKAAQEARIKKETSCARQANPSIVIPNAVIGTMMPFALDRLVVNQKFEPFTKNVLIYNSLVNKKFLFQSARVCTCQTFERQ